MIGKPDVDFDSNRHYVSQPTSWRKNHMMISLVFPTDVKKRVLGNDETQLITAAIPLNRSSESFDHSTKGKLVDIMKILFHVLKNASYEDAAKVAELMSAQEMINHALCDRSFFTRMIVALGSGQAIETLLDDTYGRNVYAQSTYLALWSAGEMLRRSTSERPGALQRLISKHCDVQKAPKVLQELFCRMRISCSYKTTRLLKISKVETKLAAGWDMSWRRWSILHVCFDNVGFKKRGQDCGYDQFTMLQLHTASIQLLKKLGFYLPRGSNKKPIDRKRTPWSEKKGTMTKKSILPDNKDWICAGEQTLAKIQCLMELNSQIPFLNDCYALLEVGGFDVETKLVTDYGVRARIRKAEGNEDICDIVEAEVYEEEDGDPTEQEVVMDDPCVRDGLTMCRKCDQHIEIDKPMHADLNCVNTVTTTVVSITFIISTCDSLYSTIRRMCLCC
jgi:hypothetical protein